MEAQAPEPARDTRGDRTYVWWLVAGDMCVCALALLVAYIIRVALYYLQVMPALRHPLEVYLAPLPVILIVWLIVLESAGLYRPRRSVSRFTEFVATFKACTLTVLVLMALAYLRKYDYARTLTGIFWLLLVNLSWAYRSGMSALWRQQLRSGQWRRRAAIMGCGELGGMVLARMQQHPDFGYEAVGFVSWDHAVAPGSCHGLPVLGEAKELPRVLAEHAIDEVFVAEPDLRPGELLDVVGECEDHPAVFRLVTGPMDALTATMDIDGIADLPIVTLRNRPFRTWQRMMKRGMDLMVGGIALLVTLPVWAVVAVAIRMDSCGPALFRQARVGLGGREFMIYKFRSMAGADGEVTRVGQFLRRSSLDELPNLLNVLRGEMSLVGPRPEMPQIVAGYEPWQRKRLEVKPGMTGLWQILGRKDLPLTDNIQYDFYYIRNQSLSLDLAILLKTASAVLKGRGAY
jgi:exopolysaccharide biosynthesis polyprenyl glycosylphosphotransferase